MRDKNMWLKIYGKDADLLAYCQRRGAVTPTLDIILDFLDQYEVSDEEFKRRHLPKTAKLWLERLAAWRFGFKTYEEEFPTLSYWCERLNVSRKHLIRIWRFLVRLGLLDEPEDHKRGRALRFGVRALLNKIRAWLGISTDSQPVVEESQPEPWAEEQPKPAPVPEPEPAPEPLPIAALVRAPEWELSFPTIQKHVSKWEFKTWFEGTEAYRQNGVLVIETRSAYQKMRLQMPRFRDMIDYIFGEGRWTVACCGEGA